MGMTVRVLCLILTACLVTASARAEELSGKWTAEVQGRDGDILAITMELKEEGEGLLTGTVRSMRGQELISSGTVDGDQISFSVVTDFDGHHRRQHYRGKVESDVIHFSLTLEDGGSEAASVRDFDAQRVS
jgi:hypothetical protein